MDRSIVYPSAIPLDADVLIPQQDAMIAIGYALQAAYGGNTVAVGLQCNPTAPASMQVTVGPGGIITQSVIESTPFGSIPADTSDPLVKMGINVASTPFTLTAPTTAGQSQNYLIQCSFAEADDTPATLSYYNSLNPSQPFSGPGNSGTPQNTRRAQRANLQLKVGTPANTGTQTTPPVDTGYIGLWVITVGFGQTSVASNSISAYPNAPFLAPHLSSHHGGVPGQAPKINLATEVQGVLGAANLPSAVGSSLVYAGNPNGHVAGTAASGATPPMLCWDTVNLEWWTCITTGTSTTAVWSQVQNGTKNTVAFTASGTFTVPAGVTQIKVWGAGGGGGGGGCAATGAGAVSIAPGGNSGSWGWGYFNVVPGTAYPVTIGAGGAGGAAGGGNGGTGGTTSFGSLLSLPGGAGAGGMNVGASPPIVQSPNPVATFPAGNTYYHGGSVIGGPAIAGTVSNLIGGCGGSGPYGGPGVFSIGSAVSAAGQNAFGVGSGGGGASTHENGTAQPGGAGSPGAVIIEW